MITQKLMLSFASQAPANPLDSIKTDVNEKKSTSKFSDLLDKAVNDAPSKKTTSQSYSQSIKSKEDIKRDFEPEKKFNTFREIAKKVNSTERPDGAVADSKAESTDDVAAKSKLEEDAKKIKTKADVAIESLAAVLGIKPDELKKLLDAIKIKPDDLLDTSKTSEIANKLSDLMGLNTDQKHVLSDVIEAIDKKVDALQLKPVESDIKEPVNANGASEKKQEPSVKLDSSNVKNVDQTDVTKNLEDILAKLKSQVEVLTQKLQQNQTNVLKEVNAVVEQVLEQSKTAVEEKNGATVETAQPLVKDSVETEDVQKLNVSTENSDKLQAKASAHEKPDNKENNKKESLSEDGDTAKTVQDDVKVTDNKTLQFTNVLANQPQKTDAGINVSKIVQEAPIPRSEIINQVIEKAKVTLTGEKSEMVMDLKPDSLGKLALKVVTERGMVVAKFIAESQQVKEVIESNMQLLKDSLEKQGLSVQGFSVSVQQDSSRGFNRFKETSEKDEKGNLRLDSIKGNMVNGKESPELQKRSNPYMWSESKINLTA